MDQKNIQNRGDETDAQLKDLLNTWAVPPASSRLDSRTLAAYRVTTAREPAWRRLLVFRIPLPVAFACGVLLVAATAIAMHRPISSATTQVQIKTVTETKTIEVPVVKERVVTRIVYRDRKPAQVAQSTPKRDDDQKLAVANEADGNGYLTNTELTGFQPNADMSLKVIKRSAQNEK
jgi:hypothetical protein